MMILITFAHCTQPQHLHDEKQPFPPYTGRVTGRDKNCDPIDEVTTILVPVDGGMIDCSWPTTLEEIATFNGGDGCEKGGDPDSMPLM